MSAERDLAIARAVAAADVREGLKVPPDDDELRAIIADVDKQFAGGAYPPDEQPAGSLDAPGRTAYRPCTADTVSRATLSPRAALIAAVRAGYEAAFAEMGKIEPYADEDRFLALVPEAARRVLLDSFRQGYDTARREIAEDPCMDPRLGREYFQGKAEAYAKAAAIARQYYLGEEMAQEIEAAAREDKGDE